MERAAAIHFVRRVFMIIIGEEATLCDRRGIYYDAPPGPVNSTYEDREIDDERLMILKSMRTEEFIIAHKN